MANAPYPIRGLGDWWNELRQYINDRPTESKIVDEIPDPGSVIGGALNAAIADSVSMLDMTGKTTAQINTWLAIPSPIGVKRLVGSHTLTAALVVHSDTYLDCTGSNLIRGATSSKRMLENYALGKTGARDHDIHLVGGYWDRMTPGAATSDGNDTHGIVFHRVDRSSVSDVRFKGEGGKYAIYGVDVNHYRVERCDITNSSDGVHVTGPFSDVTVRDIAGDTHDDLVSFTGRDYTTYELTAGGGDGAEITIERITLRSGDGNTVKVLPGQGKTTSGVTIRDIMGNPVNSSVVLYSDTVQAATTGGTLKDVTIDGVAGMPSAAGFMVNVAHPDVENLTVRNIKVSGNASPRAVAFSTSGGVCKRAIVDGITSTIAYTGSFVHVGGGYTVQDLKVANVSVTSGTGLGTVVQVSGTVGNLQGSNINQVGGRAVVNIDGVGSCPLAAFSGLSSSATYGVFVNNAAATVEVQMSNVTGIPTGRLVFNNAGTTRLRGSGITGVAASHIGKSAGTISATGTDVRADTSTLTPLAGDVVINTATGEPVGGGRAVYTGTAWVNQQTGASVTASPTYAPGAIAAAGQVEMTSTIPAAVGDLVRVVPPAGIEAGLTWSAWVSAPNTVKVRITNLTAASITPASATWKILVTRS